MMCRSATQRCNLITRLELAISFTFRAYSLFKCDPTRASTDDVNNLSTSLCFKSDYVSLPCVYKIVLKVSSYLTF